MYWLALAPSAWRAGIQVVATGMSTIYLLAVRRMLPHAQLAVDLFHVVVRLANKTLGDVRRATRQKYGRRGKSGDPENCIGPGQQRNLEDLRPGQVGKLVDTLDADVHGQRIAIAWIAKEDLAISSTCAPASPARSRTSGQGGTACGSSTGVGRVWLSRW